MVNETKNPNIQSLQKAHQTEGRETPAASLTQGCQGTPIHTTHLAPTCECLEIVGEQQVLFLQALDRHHRILALALGIHQSGRPLLQPLGNGVQLAVRFCQLEAQGLHLIGR